MAYTKDLEILAARFALNPRDVLFCQLVAAGAARGDAYTVIYNHQANVKQPTEVQDTKAGELIRNTPALSHLIRQFKNERNTRKITPPQPEEQPKQYDTTQYTTREGIVKKIMDATEGLTGKDELQGLLSLAKIQGLDKPEERSTEDLRRFFVAFKSDCRRCALMKLYRSVKPPKKG